uniref:Uncharacterized protein n=1 Tax=uncultured proteobacterium 90H6 TaxID=1240598 RepID=R9QQR1_9PROT|nr:hypothetical protein [uncultured proteobacterium 90H6]
MDFVSGWRGIVQGWTGAVQGWRWRARLCLGWSAFRCFALDWPGIRPGGRPLSLRRQRKGERKATRLPRSFAARTTPLRCSHRAAGAELVGYASSDSRAGKPRPLLRCSAGQNGLFANTARLLKQGTMINAKTKPQGLASAGLSAEARCLAKARSDPPSSGTAGGVVRRGCLSPQGEFRAGRLA